MLFIYGDNWLHQGYGGQAIIRDEPNTFGVPTKHKPYNSDDSFFSDDTYDANIEAFKLVILALIEKSRNYDYIVFPKDGLGTGLAKLPEKAPKTYKYMCEAIEHLRTVI
jgi:hypothetical protein